MERRTFPYYAGACEWEGVDGSCGVVQVGVDAAVDGVAEEAPAGHGRRYSWIWTTRQNSLSLVLSFSWNFVFVIFQEISGRLVVDPLFHGGLRNRVQAPKSRGGV